MFLEEVTKAVRDLPTHEVFSDKVQDRLAHNLTVIPIDQTHGAVKGD